MYRERVTKPIPFTYIQQLLNSNDSVILEFYNSKGMTTAIIEHLKKLSNLYRLQIRIIGGYDDQKINDYPHYKQRYLRDSTYTLNEMHEILRELETIEKGIKPEWDDLEKLMYFIGYLKNKIIYHPFFESVPSKDIRSLVGLYTRKTVCAGYALILKELCDRNGVECQYVEGSDKISEVQRGWATHAWNIVKIKGYWVPVDLTWNAGKNNRGRMLNYTDLFNVNEFVKEHIPLKKEPVQDYEQNLKSIVGTKINILDSFINKDMRFENNAFHGRRRDGSTYEITLVGQFIQNNQAIYRYYYQGFKNGIEGKPLILYSTLNISAVVNAIYSIEKINQDIKDAYSRNDLAKAHELEEKVKKEKVQYFYDVNDLCDDLLFSPENVRKAVLERHDYFIGGVKLERNDKDNLEAKGVFVDTQLGQEIGLKQKTCKRSDGTSIIIEDYGKMVINGNIDVYRFRIYEAFMRDGKKIIVKNTIFSDINLLEENDQRIYDNYLSRIRLDSVTNEANGYLGTFSSRGICIYNPTVKQFFKDMCKTLAIKDNEITDYYSEITIKEMGRLVATYEQAEINGQKVLRNRVSGRIISDPDLILRTDFAYLWLFAAGTKADSKDPEGIYGYKKAFDFDSSLAFMDISKAIVKSMIGTGNIDPVKILMDFQQSPSLCKNEVLLVRLFNSPEAVNIINKLYRLQNPSALQEKGDIEYFSKGRLSNAQILINRRRNLEAAKIILEVYRDNNENVRFRRQ